MATFIRKTTRIEETTEVVVAAGVPTPAPVAAPARKPAPALESKPLDGPAEGHIVRVVDGWAGRPGGRLPADGKFKVISKRASSRGTWLVAGLRGTATEGREGWFYEGEMVFLATSLDTLR